ncbi:GAF domain-containing protein [Phormidesmis sp. 146-12]
MKFFALSASPTVRFVRQLVGSDPSQVPDVTDTHPDVSLTTQEIRLEADSHTFQLDDLDDSHRERADASLTAQEGEVSHFSQLDDDAQTPTIMQKLEQSESSHNPSYEIIHPPTYETIHPMPNSIHSGETLTENADHSALSWLVNIADQMRHAEAVEHLFEITVSAARQCLQTDRVLIYRFENNQQGVVLAESMVNGYTPSLKEFLPAIAFGAKQAQDYQQQAFIALEDQESLTPHQLQLLERFQVKASLSFPIWVEEQLWGLLVAQRCADSRKWQAFELDRLNQIAKELRLHLQPVVARAQKQKKVEQDRIITRVINKIHQSQDVSSVFQTTTHEVRQQLKCDRVAVYRFNPDWTGQFISESVGKTWTALVGLNLETAWNDTYMQETQGGRYRNHESIAIDDIYNAGHSPCHIEILEGFEVKAYAIAPIFDGDTLWGLLAAYQNSKPRHWEPTDVSLLVQVGQQFGLALRQAESLEQVRSQSIQLNREIEHGQAITDVIDKLRQTLEVDAIFKTVTQEIRRLLNVERVTIYKFRSDFFGDFVAESEAKGLPQLVGSGWEDPYLQEHKGGRFLNNEPLVIDDIYNAGLTDCHIEALENYSVKACLVVSIFHGQELWGLLSAFQNSKPRHWEEEDIRLMMRVAAPFGFSLQQAEYIEQLRTQAKQLARAVEQQQFTAKVVEQIRQSLDLEKTFKTTAREIRGFLEVDRVALFKLYPESGYTIGETIAESVKPGFVSALSIKVEDHCFGDGFAEHYKKGRVCAIDDIYNAGLTDCYIEVLAQFQVKADLVVGVLKGGELWGLLCIHHCSEPRHWQETEIEFIKQIAAQLGVAIQQGNYAQQLKEQSQQLAESALQEKTAKEQLQQEVIQVLMSVRPSLEGDLTVRAPVTDTEVGTVADAYNNTLNSLRQIVMQMQTAASQVTQTTQMSDTSITTLTAQAQEQLHSIDQALQQVQTMVDSTGAVEINAQQVEAAVQQTNQTVLAGDAAIDRTVEEMEDIRETVVETSKRLQRLSESSQKISRVVSLIGNFTTQTQLLALNASIEATRAGEFGRGFGVVADEVRSLARQSATAATEIEQLVQEIQASTAEVSTAMEVGIQQVESGTTVVNEARQNLNEIVSATAQISQLVTGITQATQAQTQQCQSVTQTMSKVAAIAHKTSEDSVTISASFKHLLATAQDLQSKSEQFKVN